MSQTGGNQFHKLACSSHVLRKVSACKWMKYDEAYILRIQKQQASLIALDLLLFIDYVCCLRKVLFETKCRRAPTNNYCCLFQEQVTHILAIQGHGENHQTSPWLSIHRSSFPDCCCPQKDPALDHHEIPHAPWINGHKWPQMATKKVATCWFSHGISWPKGG